MSARLARAVRALWRFVREWSGDLAYETYLARVGAGATPMSREAFYLDVLRRRYRNASRCC